MKDQEKIIARARRGDADAFEQLVVSYRDQAFRLALRMCGSEADADEVAQEAFLSAWKALPNFRGESQFSTWLYQLTTHAAIDLMRREKRQIAAADITEVSAADPAPSPQQQAEQSEQREIVRDAILQLAPEQREVVVLRFMEELSYEEIGAVLKLPSGTVKSRLNRAKAQLKEILSKSGNLFGAGASYIQKQKERRRGHEEQRTGKRRI